MNLRKIYRILITFRKVLVRATYVQRNLLLYAFTNLHGEHYGVAHFKDIEETDNSAQTGGMYDNLFPNKTTTSN